MDASLFETKLVWATERVVEPASQHSSMYPEDIPVWLLLRGQVRLSYADEVTEAAAGQWVFPKRGAARHDFGDGARLLSVRFRLRWRQGEEVFARTRTLVLPDAPRGELRRAAAALAGLGVSEHILRGLRDNRRLSQVQALRLHGRRAAEPAVESPRRFLAVQAAFARWLEAYAETVETAGLSWRPPSDIDARLVRARELLDAAPLDQRLSRTGIAAQAGWSLPQFMRRFTAVYGLTPRAYFEQRRLGLARTELMRGSWTIKQIAAELGFRSLAEFSNWFTRHTGQSPRKYRGQVHV